MTSIDTSRRGLFRSGGAVVLAAGVGGLATTACTGESPSAAYAPWEEWQDPARRGTPLALVAAAVLAANPHDSQPWRFAPRDDAIEVFADTGRHLGAMDPFLREMHIGLGCALELTTLAAAANGFAATIEPVPGGLDALTDRRGLVHAATVRLRRDSAAIPSRLSRAIPLRHTNRYPYDRAAGLPRGWRDGLAGLATDPAARLLLFDDGAARGAWDSAVNDATATLVADTPMIADSDRWLRRTPAQIETFRSGPTLRTAGLSAMTLWLAERLPLSADAEHKAWVAHTRDDQVATAALTGFILVRDPHDRVDALAAGRLWQRLHLDAVAAGVAMQPLNQPVEMVDRERQLGGGDAWARRMSGFAGMDGWRPTFAFRAGIARQTAPPSPRRALADVLVSGRPAA